MLNFIVLYMNGKKKHLSRLLFHWKDQHIPGGKQQKSRKNAGDSGDTDLIPGLGRSPGGGNSNPLQYSCLENPMHEGALPATVHRVPKRQIRRITAQNTEVRKIKFPYLDLLPKS